MDAVSGDLMGIVASTMAMQEMESSANFGVSIMKGALEMQEMLGREIAEMLQVGTMLDITG